MQGHSRGALLKVSNWSRAIRNELVSESVFSQHSDAEPTHVVRNSEINMQHSVAPLQPPCIMDNDRRFDTIFVADLETSRTEDLIKSRIGSTATLEQYHDRLSWQLICSVGILLVLILILVFFAWFIALN